MAAEARRTCQVEQLIADQLGLLLQKKAAAQVWAVKQCRGQEVWHMLPLCLLLQVGLLLGKPAVGTRDLLLGLIKTPPQVRVRACMRCRCAFSSGCVRLRPTYACWRLQDGREPVQAFSQSQIQTIKKKGSQAVHSAGAAASGSVQLDVQWIGEHAAQVTRML